MPTANAEVSSPPAKTPSDVAEAVAAVPAASPPEPIADKGGPASVPRPVANPLISRGKPVHGHALVMFSKEEALVDGQYRTYGGAWRAGTPKPGEPAWAAVQVGRGPKKLLLVWSDGGSYNFNETTYGAPADYRVDVSADSSNGADGSWKTVASVRNNLFHAREHSFPFDGQSWVKVVLLRAPDNSPNGIALEELELFDLSGGGTDSWFFMGDSITAFNFDRESTHHQPSYAELVHRANPRFFPAMINAGIGGENSSQGLAHIDEWLTVAPDFKYWAIGYGTNDAADNNANTTTFESNMEALVQKVLAAGRVPILARIPFAADGTHAHLEAFNAVVDKLTKKHNLASGPDLYDWFLKNPDQLVDKLHPGEDKLHPSKNGIVEANRLWWQATRWLYAP
ncbi:MAG TPA: SGNH/GDSL hydrolase family protein [Polyangiaceae bacterium]